MQLFSRIVACCLLLTPFLATADAASCLLAIDIGHDRSAAGAKSARGKPEWFFNNALARLLYQRAIEQNLQAILINPSGASIRLSDRPQLAQAAQASCLISIHHDSVQAQYLLPWNWNGNALRYSDRFRGYGLFVSGKNPAFAESRKIAHDIADSLLQNHLSPSLHHAEPIAGENRPLLDPQRGIYQFDDLVVLRQANMPAVLVEAGVIVHRDQEREVSTPDQQNKIVEAILAAFRLHCRRQTPS